MSESSPVRVAPLGCGDIAGQDLTELIRRPSVVRSPVHLCGDLYQVAGGELTHPFDASAYVLLGSEPVLFDCGSQDGHRALTANLHSLGLAPGDLAAVCATHGHYDHVSGAAALGVPLWLHPAERAAVEAGDPVLTAAQALYGREFPALAVARDLRDGELLTFGGVDVRVVHSPGHSPGSVCFLLETGGLRVLLAGDTLWGGFHPALGSDIAAWQWSLERLAGERFDVMSFGHCVSHLVLDAHAKVVMARRRLGVMFDPWFEPPCQAPDL